MNDSVLHAIGNVQKSAVFIWFEHRYGTTNNRTQFSTLHILLKYMMRLLLILLKKGICK